MQILKWWFDSHDNHVWIFFNHMHVYINSETPTPLGWQSEGRILYSFLWESFCKAKLEGICHVSGAIASTILKSVAHIEKKTSSCFLTQINCVITSSAWPSSGIQIHNPFCFRIPNPPSILDMKFLIFLNFSSSTWQNSIYYSRITSKCLFLLKCCVL